MPIRPIGGVCFSERVENSKSRTIDPLFQIVALFQFGLHN